MDTLAVPQGEEQSGDLVLPAKTSNVSETREDQELSQEELSARFDQNMDIISHTLDSFDANTTIRDLTDIEQPDKNDPDLANRLSNLMEQFIWLQEQSQGEDFKPSSTSAEASERLKLDIQTLIREARQKSKEVKNGSENPITNEDLHDLFSQITRLRDEEKAINPSVKDPLIDGSFAALYQEGLKATDKKSTFEKLSQMLTSLQETVNKLKQSHLDQQEEPKDDNPPETQTDAAENTTPKPSSEVNPETDAKTVAKQVNLEDQEENVVPEPEPDQETKLADLKTQFSQVYTKFIEAGRANDDDGQRAAAAQAEQISESIQALLPGDEAATFMQKAIEEAKQQLVIPPPEIPPSSPDESTGKEPNPINEKQETPKLTEREQQEKKILTNLDALFSGIYDLWDKMEPSLKRELGDRDRPIITLGLLNSITRLAQEQTDPNNPDSVLAKLERRKAKSPSNEGITRQINRLMILGEASISLKYLQGVFDEHDPSGYSLARKKAIPLGREFETKEVRLAGGEIDTVRVNNAKFSVLGDNVLLVNSFDPKYWEDFNNEPGDPVIANLHSIERGDRQGTYIFTGGVRKGKTLLRHTNPELIYYRNK